MTATATRYLDTHAAQAIAIGKPKQEKIGDCKVGIVGLGRVGAATSFQLPAAGFRHVTGIDPQPVSEDTKSSPPYARAKIGEPKVYALERAFHDQFGLPLIAIHATIESSEGETAIKEVDMGVCVANSPSAHITTTRIFTEQEKPFVSAGVVDGRERFYGAIRIWHPKYREAGLACPACYIANGDGDDSDTPLERGEGLYSPMIWAVASLTVHCLINLLTEVRQRQIGSNYIDIDLDQMRIEAFTVRRNEDCTVCAMQPSLTPAGR